LEEIPEYINLLSYLFIVVYMLSVPLGDEEWGNTPNAR
jgi:hypothetical protein